MGHQMPIRSILVESIQAAVVGVEAAEFVGGWLQAANKGSRAAAKSRFFIRQAAKINATAQREPVIESTVLRLKLPPNPRNILL